MHKNNNDAVGNYGIYEIYVSGKLYKIGKADLDRITKCSGDPTRIHQQLRILRKKHGIDSVVYELVERLFGVTTSVAKEFEREFLKLYYELENEVPDGNKKSFKY